MQSVGLAYLHKGKHHTTKHSRQVPDKELENCRQRCCSLCEDLFMPCPSDCNATLLAGCIMRSMLSEHA